MSPWVDDIMRPISEALAAAVTILVARFVYRGARRGDEPAVAADTDVEIGEAFNRLLKRVERVEQANLAAAERESRLGRVVAAWERRWDLMVALLTRQGYDVAQLPPLDIDDTGEADR